MQPIEREERFNTPSGEVVIATLAARCDRCDFEAVLPSQMKENIERRRARAIHYQGHLLGEDYLAFRKKYGLSQQDASRIIGKGKIAFSRYENEATFPDESTSKLIRLAMKHMHILKELAEESGVRVPLLAERVEEEKRRKVFPLVRCAPTTVVQRSSSYRVRQANDFPADELEAVAG
jgi:putative zinc finger/helix-turn-helix YgiT family protein